MGRHQAYLIAKVVPHESTKPNYRCIGAIHHQLCSASRPLSATLRFLKLIKQPENLEIVREEIKALKGKYGGYLRQRPLIPAVPCPFTSFLMISTWAVDLKPESSGFMYLSNVHEVNACAQITEAGAYIAS